MSLGGRHKVVLVESRSSERAEEVMSLADLMEQVCREDLTSLTEMKRSWTAAKRACGEMLMTATCLALSR